MGAWVVGRNIAGYLPEADTFAFESWGDASIALQDEMREYADTDDESALESAPEVPNDFPVKQLHSSAGPGITQCGECFRYWVASGGPSLTPAPAGRCPFEDFHFEQPAMRATVDSILKDDPPQEGKEWAAIVQDERERPIVFWLNWSNDREPNDHED